jgi:nucleoside-diphosphate-sugar epimerase
VHTLDAARLYRLALESAAAGSRLHAVSDSGIPFREVAAAIAAGLKVPTASIAAGDVAEHFSHLALFVGMDNPVSSDRTRTTLGWQPLNDRLIDNLDHYLMG